MSPQPEDIFSFSDDDGGEFNDLLSITISEVENGYMITEFFEDEECTYVFNDVKDMLRHVKKLYDYSSGD